MQRLVPKFVSRPGVEPNRDLVEPMGEVTFPRGGVTHDMCEGRRMG